MVISIIAMLIAILAPSLTTVKEYGRSAKCLSNLHNLGVAMQMYQISNRTYFWPYLVRNELPRWYFWGSDTVPVDRSVSPLLAYCDKALDAFWCPSQPWGSYLPQGSAKEPTTTYGYNAFCLDPNAWGRKDSSGKLMPLKRTADIKNPSDLFVFADSGMTWKTSGVVGFQNSSSLDPLRTQWGINKYGTTHFRHLSRTNALCADGRADSFDREGSNLTNADALLGFVGTSNVPHYDNDNK